MKRGLSYLSRAALAWNCLLVVTNIAMYEHFSVRRLLVDLGSMTALFCSNCAPTYLRDASDSFHAALEFVPDAGYDFEVMYFDQSNFTFARAAELTKDFTLPFIAKNALASLKQFDFDKVREEFANDVFTWQEGSDMLGPSREMRLHDALDAMKGENAPLYLRFNKDIAAHNPYFNNATDAALGAVGVPVTNERYNKLCFIAYGDTHGTTLHNALSDNWFVQFKGAKTWRIMKPNVAPFLKPRVTAVNPATNSLLKWLPDNSSIPYADVTSEEGDLFYFPAFWWHSVQNVNEGFQFGCGFRPQKYSMATHLKSTLVPPLAGPAINLYAAHVPASMNVIGRKVIGKLFPSLAYQDSTWWTKLKGK